MGTDVSASTGFGTTLHEDEVIDYELAVERLRRALGWLFNQFGVIPLLMLGVVTTYPYYLPRQRITGMGFFCLGLVSMIALDYRFRKLVAAKHKASAVSLVGIVLVCAVESFAVARTLPTAPPSSGPSWSKVHEPGATSGQSWHQGYDWARRHRDVIPTTTANVRGRRSADSVRPVDRVHILVGDLLPVGPPETVGPGLVRLYQGYCDGARTRALPAQVWEFHRRMLHLLRRGSIAANVRPSAMRIE
ncbi:hypothetical protein AaE_010729 [Aphanomyces astaci]|uniref:Uncharacterized protein n=1 Tax=Aphanomyces astaci TaxID=112090 RepID=A0A6A5A3K7_APHAT|nr:hypothetical protein AaE_010729 [Aphanomyces astaci]